MPPPRPGRRQTLPRSRRLVGPFVDLRLDVAHLGGDVGLHLSPLAASAIGRLASVLPSVLEGQVRVDLCLVDALLQLLS